MKDKIRGSLVGGAIGDALGYAVEFVGSYSSIQEKYGEMGITQLVSEKSWSGYANDSDKAVISDDTQMTLFTACGLLNAESPEQRKCAIRDAYVEWYYTQKWYSDRKSGKCWIAEIPEINRSRDPGGTCMSAMEIIIAGLEPHNNSKGCGGVMRTAPVALYGAVAGNIIGTIVGYDAIPQYYKDDLELHDVILKVADDLSEGKIIRDVPIYNSYKVTDWLYAGEYPGDKGTDRAEVKIRQCLDFGINHFIDLTEEGELVPYKTLIEGRAEYLRFPIRYVSVPNDTISVRELMEKIEDWHKTWIHICWWKKKSFWMKNHRRNANNIIIRGEKA